MNRPSVKAVISSLLLLTFLFMAASGAMLYFGKTGIVLGFARGAIRNAHTLAAVVMGVLATLHLIMNCSLYMSEMKVLVRHKKSNEIK